MTDGYSDDLFGNAEVTTEASVDETCVKYYESEIARTRKYFCGDEKLARYWIEKHNGGNGDGT